MGLPLDMHVYEADTFRHGLRRRIEVGDAYFEEISSGWGEALRAAVQNLPSYRLD